MATGARAFSRKPEHVVWGKKGMRHNWNCNYGVIQHMQARYSRRAVQHKDRHGVSDGEHGRLSVNHGCAAVLLITADAFVPRFGSRIWRWSKPASCSGRFMRRQPHPQAIGGSWRGSSSSSAYQRAQTHMQSTQAQPSSPAQARQSSSLHPAEPSTGVSTSTSVALGHLTSSNSISLEGPRVRNSSI